MRLSDLKPAEGATRKRKRVGRGIGSGHGRTAGKGTKGQKARNKVRLGFEGGQTPLHRRLPQLRGFKNKFKKEYAIVNLTQLARFEAGTVVTPELLQDQKVVKKLGDGLKILGEGEIDRALTVRAHKFSKTAEEKIRAAGGAVEVIS